MIGNPPYVERRMIQDEYDIRHFVTEPTNNLFAYFAERGVSLLCGGARFGFIIPVSSISTDKFASLQNIIRSQDTVWLSHYDDRAPQDFSTDLNMLDSQSFCTSVPQRAVQRPPCLVLSTTSGTRKSAKGCSRHWHILRFVGSLGRPVSRKSARRLKTIWSANYLIPNALSNSTNVTMEGTSSITRGKSVRF